MMRPLLVCLAMLTATMAHGAPVTVRAGAHSGFTRIVLDFEDRPDWAAVPGEASFSIAFQSDEAMEFDLSDAFRLLEDPAFDLRAEGNSLEIRYDCDCSVDLRNQSSNALVVEIRDRAFRETSQLIDPAPKQPARPTIDGIKIPAPPPHDQRPGFVAPAPVSGEPAPVFDRDEFLGIAAGSTSEHVDLPIEPEDHGRAILSLGRELSRAAAQGLVDANPDPADRSVAQPGFHDRNIGEDRANLSATTGLDREIMALRDEVPPTNMGVTCFPDSEVDLAAWGEVALLGDLGMLRGDAVAEDGSILPSGALALARYYLALGFGVEAKAYADFLEPGKGTSLIRALGDIVDEAKTDSDILDGQIFCKGKVALWALLARPLQSSEIPTSTNDIMATFSALPRHLRAHLGPTLAERLRTAGLEEEARIAVNAVSRGGADTDESALVSARMALSGTGHDAAQSKLEDLSSGTDVTAAAALIDLLDDAARRGMPPNPDWVEDAPSLVRATVGTEVSPRLHIAALRGHIALGQFDRFREALDFDMPGIDTTIRQALAAEALAAAVDIAGPVEFLKAEIGLSPLAPEQLIARETGFNLAKRLAGMGLARRALAYLPDEPHSLDEAIVTAAVLTSTGDTARAVDLLTARTETEAFANLGTVLSSIGRDAEAVSVLAAGGQMDAAIEAAMRVGNWEWIASRDGTVSDAAGALLSPSLEPAEASASNANLIRESEALRSHAAILLGETNPDQAFTN